MPTASIARRGGTIRLTLSAKAANNLDSLQKSLKVVAERLGHPACATGCDILHLGQEVEFTMGEKVELNPQPLPPRSGLDVGSNAITVTIPDRTSRNIEALTHAVGVVMGKLGCGQCCSGFDILFRREINTMALNEKGEVAHFGGIS